jgi:D-alanyl-D-alanine carboxypeptidase
MKKTFVAAITAALVLGSAGVALANGISRLQADTDQLIRYGAPGALVELDTPSGDVKVRSGYGNTSTRTPVPWDAEFRIGSFTKTYVSATALQLVGEHRLSLDDTVEHWLPGVVTGNGNDGSKITVRNLLQHTSGLPEYLMGYPWLADAGAFEQHRFDTTTPEQAVATAMQFPPNFAPGTSWSYSNTNYQLAGMIIQKVTGHTWQEEVQRRIVKPLGLRHTFTPGTSPEVPDPHAIGYQRFPGPNATQDDPDYGDPIDVTRLNPSWGGAAGEIISTTHDGNTFLRALIGGRVLKPAQLAEMEKTVPVNAEFNGGWPGARYGLGLMWVPNSCGGSWSHGGDIHGYKTRNGVTPDGRRSVVVTVNTDSLWPQPGVTFPTTDAALDLIDHALCGKR